MTTNIIQTEKTPVKESARHSIVNFLLKYGMVLAIILITVFFSIANEYFLSLSNFLDILRAVSILAIVATGVTMTVVVNGLDASVGAVTGLVLGGLFAPRVYAAPPVVYQPAPVYVQPAPVYVQPSPVYAEPPPVVYQPAPVYVAPRRLCSDYWIETHWNGYAWVGGHWARSCR